MSMLGFYRDGSPYMKEVKKDLSREGSFVDLPLLDKQLVRSMSQRVLQGDKEMDPMLKPNDGDEGDASDYDSSERDEEFGELSDDDFVCSSSGQDSSFALNIERCIAASTKGFVIGAGLRGGLALFAILSRFKRRASARSSGKSNREAIMEGLKETLRYGLFLGTFAGGFSTVDETIAAVGGRRETGRWRSLAAGAIAGPSLLLTGPKTRHTSMALYILMRASVLAARCGIKSKRMGWLCRPMTWKHGDTFLMCLSSSQILSAWILKPNSLPSSYISFLNTHSGKDTSIVKGINALAFKSDLQEKYWAVEQHYRKKGINLSLSPDMRVPCKMIHGNQGCVEHFVRFLGRSYFRSIPVYLPVYLVPALLVHRQGLFARPFPVLPKTILGTARSSLFLTAYCASAWLSTCGVFRLFDDCSPVLVALGTFPSGLSVLIEKKSRRMELALYCFSRAVESFAICVNDSGLLQHLKLSAPDRMDVVVFSMATSIIMHCYAEERDVFRSKYLNVLDWVFGVPDPRTSAKSAPSRARRKARLLAKDREASYQSSETHMIVRQQ